MDAQFLDTLHDRARRLVALSDQLDHLSRALSRVGLRDLDEELSIVAVDLLDIKNDLLRAYSSSLTAAVHAQEQHTGEMLKALLGRAD